MLLAWAATCLLDVDHVAVAVAAALSPAITVLAVPVVALGVGRRHPVPAAMATVAAAIPWVLVAGYGAEGPGVTSARGATAMRVMMINANRGGADPARIAELARQNGTAVVVVTEMTSRLAHDLTGAGLNAVVTPRLVEVDDGTRGIGVYTAEELTDARPVTGLSRPAATGVLQTQAGPVGLLVAHGSRSAALVPSEGWHADLARLPELAPPVERRIMIGDFSATPWNPAFRRMASGEWHDAADVVGRGLRPTWPSWTPLPISPLDHVLVAGSVGVNSVETATVAGTDHRALIVTVLLRK